MSKIEYNTNHANARKGQRDNLLKELDQVKRDLVQLTQEIGKLDTTGNTSKPSENIEMVDQEDDNPPNSQPATGTEPL